ncbi:MAG: type II toxin-antitoxin system VapC family toxin [Acidimicrobiales bacterium]
MIAYFDTSAVIPLLIEEEGSERAALIWNEAYRVASVRLVYAEGRAALAMAHRIGQLNRPALQMATRGLERLYRQMDIVEISDAVVRQAGDLAEVHSLRGYDAVHIAAVATLGDEEVALVAGDEALCRAATALGIPVSHV